jgi:hypothetical protein
MIKKNILKKEEKIEREVKEGVINLKEKCEGKLKKNKNKKR